MYSLKFLIDKRKNKWPINKRRCKIIPAFRCHDFILEKLRLHKQTKKPKAIGTKKMNSVSLPNTRSMYKINNLLIHQ